jgi:hypothetical protein
MPPFPEQLPLQHIQAFSASQVAPPLAASHTQSSDFLATNCLKKTCVIKLTDL